MKRNASACTRTYARRSHCPNEQELLKRVIGEVLIRLVEDSVVPGEEVQVGVVDREEVEEGRKEVVGDLHEATDLGEKPMLFG